jgi:hypothetical protein
LRLFCLNSKKLIKTINIFCYKKSGSPFNPEADLTSLLYPVVVSQETQKDVTKLISLGTFPLPKHSNINNTALLVTFQLLKKTEMLSIRLIGYILPCEKH